MPEERPDKEPPAKTLRGRYGLQELTGDFLISGFAVFVGLGLLFGSGLGAAWRVFFAAFLASALWFLWRTLRLYKSRLTLDAQAGVLDYNGSVFDLKSLTNARLRFYGSYRQKKNGGGTYQLTLTFQGGKKFQADQRLDIFQDLIEAVARLNPPCDEISGIYFKNHGVNTNGKPA